MPKFLDTAMRWLHMPAYLKTVLKKYPEDRAEIIQLLQRSEAGGVIDSDILEMIKGAIQVSEIQVKNIMIPRSQMVVVRRGSSLQDMLPVIID
ncbi:MAG: hypothetical protein OXI37_09560, partial [Gammaproteobacteria bacterium]|nr:hypothetical protein [Gammaproteobacteria bacterium]